jgi:hypothetical protein
VFKGTVAGVLSFFMSAKGLRIAVQVESNEGQLLAEVRRTAVTSGLPFLFIRTPGSCPN